MITWSTRLMVSSLVVINNVVYFFRDTTHFETYAGVYLGKLTPACLAASRSSEFSLNSFYSIVSFSNLSSGSMRF
jgi:hypothetical protein